MLLDKLYNDFLTHTNLTDSVYKSVFVNLSQVLETIKAISWDYLKCVDTEGERISFEFPKAKTIPRYLVELIQNIFVPRYTLPNDLTVELGMTYKGAPYKIFDGAVGTSIPTDIEFIQKYNLFDTFILNRPVYDVFGAFNTEFKFLDSFKTEVRDVFQPLKKRFESADAQTAVRENEVAPDKLASAQFNTEALSERIKELLKEIDDIKKEREELRNSSDGLVRALNSEESVRMEQDKLSIERTTLLETKNEYAEKIRKLTTVLKKIESQLADIDANASDAIVSDREYLIRKKTLFTENKKSFESSYQDFENFLKDIDARLADISKELALLDQYTTNDVETLEKKIRSLNSQQEDSYSLLLTLENEFKQQKHSLSSNSIKLEKAQTAYSDVTLQNIENSSIVNHLATALQPASVTTVINYLRYYFAFNANRFAQDMIKVTPDLHSHVAQALASKLVLVRSFGVYFNQMFSTIDFADSRVGNVLLIVKD